LLAASTGEQFQEQVKKNGNALVRNHAELGDAAQAPGVIFAVVAVIALLVVMLRISTHPIAQKARARISLPDWLATLTLVLTLLGGIWATNAVVQAGHSGAKSVWQEQLKK
jgi:nitrate reductase gamma subunit